jgi:hypothetical protein
MRPHQRTMQFHAHRNPHSRQTGVAVVTVVGSVQSDHIAQNLSIPSSESVSGVFLELRVCTYRNNPLQ